jgi:hypothetical protein
MKKAGHIQVGYKQGRLTVLEVIPGSKTTRRRYRCRCVCGKIVTSDLRRSQSCRCFQSEIIAANNTRLKRHAFGDANLRRAFGSYIRNAQARGLVFDLEFDLFQKITRQPCFYCGLPPSQICNYNKQSHGVCVMSGIDRVNNKLGYLSTNVVPCCRQCNTAKLDSSEEDFINWVGKIYRNLQLKGIL